MARTNSSSEPETTALGGEPDKVDSAPAVVTTAEGDTRPGVGAEPVADVPVGMTAVVLDEPEPEPSQAAAGVTKAKPYLLRVTYPHDEFRVPGQGDKPQGGGEPSDLVLTREFQPVSRAQWDAARVSTRGTGIKLVGAVPEQEGGA